MDGNDVFYITGDTHRSFMRIYDFLEEKKLPLKKNVNVIILGDASINYYGERGDRDLKEWLQSQGVTLFLIHGNHEQRPESLSTYREVMWRGGMVYQEEKYPNLLFAKDGEVYDIAGKKTLVIGGAYSVDKNYRIRLNPFNPLYWDDEQPSQEIKNRVYEKLNQLNWEIDVLLSHTAPINYEPKEAFIKGLDQSLIDNSTEKWLQTVEDNLTYKKWYVGHYHIEKQVEKFEFMYKNVHEF